MEKIGNEFIGYASYNMTNCFDVAHKMYDECMHRGKSATFIHHILDWGMPSTCFTPFGKDVIKAFDIIYNKGGSTTNVGIGQDHVNFYLRYYHWLIDNGLDTTNADKFLNRMKENNPELFFEKQSDLQLFLGKGGDEE